MKVVQTIKGEFSPSVIDCEHRKVVIGYGCENVINAIGLVEFTAHYANKMSGSGNMVRVTVEILERDAR